jgi:hypothetical protein
LISLSGTNENGVAIQNTTVFAIKAEQYRIVSYQSTNG